MCKRLGLIDDPIFMQSALLAPRVKPPYFAVDAIKEFGVRLRPQSTESPDNYLPSPPSEPSAVERNGHHKSEDAEEKDQKCPGCGKEIELSTEEADAKTLSKIDRLLEGAKYASLTTLDLLIFLAQLEELAERVAEMQEAFRRVVELMPRKERSVDELTLNLLEALDSDGEQRLLARAAVQGCGFWNAVKIVNTSHLASLLETTLEAYFGMSNKSTRWANAFVMAGRLGPDEAEDVEASAEEDSQSLDLCEECRNDPLFVLVNNLSTLEVRFV